MGLASPRGIRAAIMSCLWLGTLVFLVGGCFPPSYVVSYDPMTVRAAPPPPPPPPAKPELIEISEQIRFQTNAAEILPASFRILDHVVNVMNSRPGIRLVEIQGHTDARGNAEHNKALSLARANSVREYLTSKGIAPDRLSTKGFGQERPIADNDSPQGRQMNRRVEFHIIEQTGQ